MRASRLFQICIFEGKLMINYEVLNLFWQMTQKIMGNHVGFPLIIKVMIH